MKVTLKKRIAAIIIIFAIVITCSFMAIQTHHQRHTLAMSNALRAKLTVQILQDALRKPLIRQPAHDNVREELQAAFVALSRSGLIYSVYVYSVDGIIEASTQKLLVGKRAPAAELPLIKKALSKSSCNNTIDKDIDKATRTLRVYFPVTAHDGTIFIARLDTPLGSMKEALKQAYMPFVLMLLIVIAASMLLWVSLLRRVINPISLLNTAAKEMAAGDLNLKIHVDTKDEIEELSDTFNLIATKLQKTR
jgi:HAMP domain-containing protein